MKDCPLLLFFPGVSFSLFFDFSGAKTTADDMMVFVLLVVVVVLALLGSGKFELVGGNRVIPDIPDCCFDPFGTPI